jgi:hypothetical protein
MASAIDATSARDALVHVPDGRQKDSPGTSTPVFVQPATQALQVLGAKRLLQIEALPPAAKSRELKRETDTFASSGKTVFAHFTAPILERRRSMLLKTGTRRKRYHKTAAQLWSTLANHHQFSLTYIAEQLRIAIKQGTLTHVECLKYAGKPEETKRCIWYAEHAVSQYLETPPPAPLEEVPGCVAEAAEISSESVERTKGDLVDDACATGRAVEECTSPKDVPATDTNAQEKDAAVLQCQQDFAKAAAEAAAGSRAPVAGIPLDEPTADAAGPTRPIAVDDQTHAHDVDDDLHMDELLDTLPEPFECTPNMLYSHFAHYDLDEVQAAEGKAQTAQLRHLAERFDATGKELFYYYIVPRLCQQYYPPCDGKTLTSLAAEIWRSMLGAEKEVWRIMSGIVKKHLGDGDVDGLSGCVWRAWILRC